MTRLLHWQSRSCALVQRKLAHALLCLDMLHGCLLSRVGAFIFPALRRATC